MSNYIKLKTNDNHTFQAYLSQPKHKIKGGIIIIQEIFGVNKHIREICNLYSKNGYLAIAPCLFDREKEMIELSYDMTGVTEGRRLKDLLNEKSLNEIESSINYVCAAGNVGIIGYCWGGSLSWRAACTYHSLSCSVVYYGGEVPKLKHLEPKCPVMCHFGEFDKSIPIDDVDEFININEKVDVFKYPADHGFNCNHRSQYNQKCSEIAFNRTIKFIEKNVS